MATLLAEEDRDRLLDAAAAAVVERRLEVPAVLFLEMNRPLSFVASQALIVFAPLLGPLFGPERLERLTALLEDRENVDRLLDRIEAGGAARRGGPMDEASE